MSTSVAPANPPQSSASATSKPSAGNSTPAAGSLKAASPASNAAPMKPASASAQAPSTPKGGNDVSSSSAPRTPADSQANRAGATANGAASPRPPIQRATTVASLPSQNSSSNLNGNNHSSSRAPGTPLSSASTVSTASPAKAGWSLASPLKAGAKWLGYGSPIPSDPNDQRVIIDKLRKRIKNLEEEQRLGDTFKRSMRETLGLQIDNLMLELDLERQKVKRLEAEIQSARSGGIFSPSPSAQNPERRDDSARAKDITSHPHYPAYNRLQTYLSQEREKFKSLTTGKADISKKFSEVEKSKEPLTLQLREETLFLNRLKEEKMFTGDMATTITPQQEKALKELDEKIAKGEATVKSLKDKLEQLRKDEEAAIPSGAKDLIDLHKQIGMHEQISIALYELLQSAVEGAEQLKKAAEEMSNMRQSAVSSEEKWAARTKQQTKQIEELLAKLEQEQNERRQVFEKLNAEEQLLTSEKQEKEKFEKELQARENALQSTQQTLQTQVQELQEQLTQKEKELTEATSRLEAAEEAIAQSQNAVSEVVTESATLKVKLQTAEQEVAKLKSAKQTLEQRLTAAEAAQKEQTSRIESATAELEEEKKALSAAKEENEKLREEMNKKENNLKQEDEKLRELQARFDSLQSEKAKLDAEKESLGGEYAQTKQKLEKQVADLQKQLADQKKKTEGETKKLQTAQAQKKQLEAHIESLRMLLSGVKLNEAGEEEEEKAEEEQNGSLQ